MNTHNSNIKKFTKKLSLRTRTFTLACAMFGVNLPDQATQISQHWLKSSLWRIGTTIIFALVCGFAISAMGEFISGFIDGFSRAGHDVNQSHSWELSQNLLYGLLVLLWVVTQNTLLKHAIAISLARHEVERERANQLELTGTLRLLKAQIEPHFLFNTLGAVQHLAEDKAPQAAALTADLIVFLRATIGSLRADSIQLGEDCNTCAAYLHIMQTRLPHRLSYHVDCPPELQRFQVPTSLLLTLVENAIKHGIEPAQDGGHIDICARRIDAQVIVTVSDTGAGFGETIGQGLGLENIRERLALIYQDKASLTLEENHPRGIIARLYFPV